MGACAIGYLIARIETPEQVATQPTITPAFQVTNTPLPTIPVQTPTIPPAGEYGVVIDIVDGDTIGVQIDGSYYRVRYIGMNTTEVGEPCSIEGTQANAALVAGKTVRLEKDVSETDRYGRLLRYIYVDDVFVNAELVRLGIAEAADYPPDITYSGLFHQLQAEAYDAGIGCHATGVFGTEGIVTVQNTPVIVAPTTVLAQTSDCDCNRGNSYNCRNFETHPEAQACYETCLAATGRDVHALDRDHDGSACESLPQK